MELRKIVAIVRNEVLDRVEAQLGDMRVYGLSVTRVEGVGEYVNFFNSHRLVTHSRLEIFTEESRVEAITTAIMEIAHTGMEGDGIVAVLPVLDLYRIRTKSPFQADEF